VGHASERGATSTGLLHLSYPGTSVLEPGWAESGCRGAPHHERTIVARNSSDLMSAVVKHHVTTFSSTCNPAAFGALSVLRLRRKLSVPLCAKWLRDGRSRESCHCACERVPHSWSPWASSLLADGRASVASLAGSLCHCLCARVADQRCAVVDPLTVSDQELAHGSHRRRASERASERARGRPPDTGEFEGSRDALRARMPDALGRQHVCSDQRTNGSAQ
jgi:hypothetical protein